MPKPNACIQTAWLLVRQLATRVDTLLGMQTVSLTHLRPTSTCLVSHVQTLTDKSMVTGDLIPAGRLKNIMTLLKRALQLGLCAQHTFNAFARCCGDGTLVREDDTSLCYVHWISLCMICSTVRALLSVLFASITVCVLCSVYCLLCSVYCLLCSVCSLAFTHTTQTFIQRY